MTISILCEGEYDFDSLASLVTSILKNHLRIDVTGLKFLQYCANGPSHEKLGIACSQFTDSPILATPRADFIIFHSDQDNGTGVRASRIKLRDEYQREHPGTFIAIALPNPHLEQWFFSETDSVLNYFEFRDGMPALTGKDQKERLRNLIKKYGDVTKRYQETYAEIAELIDVKKLALRDADFQYFMDDVVAVYNAANT